MQLRHFFCSLLLTAIAAPLYAQNLMPGFNKEELLQVMYVSVRTGGVSDYYSGEKKVEEPSSFRFLYRSPEIGLKNQYEIWTAGTTAVISVRGTTKDSESWLANLYAAMVPAKGMIRLTATDSFPYQVAKDPKAAVHTGWLIATGFIVKDLSKRLDSCYASGIRNLIITGHSQGGAISYLLTAYLRNQQKLGALPKDIRIKTYCTAAPKPGNLYFAYEYEADTQEGWAFNVVSAADWVPEVPFSIQTTSDFNTINPFPTIEGTIKKQPLIKRAIYRKLYKRLSKPAHQAQQNFQKYLGKYVSKEVVKSLKELEPPVYYPSNNYTRTGQSIVLTPDDSYYEKYKNDPNQFWTHHMHHPYIYLIERIAR